MPDTRRRFIPGSKIATNAAPAARRLPASSTHQVRIIGGRWKRTLLPVVAAEGLRPTPDRVRETLFNWLAHLLDHDWSRLHCLDLFAGSGALGFEAASRGAAGVIMVEAHTPAVRQLEQVRERLGASEITIVRGDASAFVKNWIAQAQQANFDLVFLDPPYHQGWVAKMLPLCAAALAPGGYVYVETEMPLIEAEAKSPQNTVQPARKPLPTEPASLPEGWKIVRADRAGLVFYHLLQHGNSIGLEA